MTISTLVPSPDIDAGRRSPPQALDNVFWRAMSGAQAAFTVGSSSTRRLASGFTPLMAAADPQRPDFDALAPHCRPGEHLHCLGWDGAAPDGWRIEFETPLCRMVWDAPLPCGDDAAGLVKLDRSHLAQVLDLVQQTQPGPFGPRMLELGDYVGHVVDGRLVAMAGERLKVDGHREISAVCTHPEFRGRGLARTLVRVLVRRQLQRDETPILHVRSENAPALGLYERMGFHIDGRTRVRIVCFLGSTLESNDSNRRSDVPSFPT